MTGGKKNRHCRSVFSKFELTGPRSPRRGSSLVIPYKIRFNYYGATKVARMSHVFRSTLSITDRLQCARGQTVCTFAYFVHY